MRTVLTGAPLYLTHFGLAEAPFSTTPDQRFIYLSDRHRDGLAHLLYGVAERGGFVQLTGEVGTGKTTLCRYLLEHLPGHVDVALILNPTMTSTELLATICQELAGGLSPGTPTVKELVDALYAHLLKAHASARRTVVIVDEAQLLSRRRARADAAPHEPRDVHDQAPADHPDRPAGARRSPPVAPISGRSPSAWPRGITSRRCRSARLAPTSLHRLAMAGQSGIVFEERALRVIHRSSGGVPRLINIVCDRALLGGYAARGARITAKIARRAVREVTGELPTTRARRRRRVALLAGGGVAAVAAAVALVMFWPSARSNAMIGARPPATQLASVAADATLSAAPRVPPTPAFKTLLDEGRVPTDADSAYAAVVARWGKTYERRGNERPCDAVRRLGLACLPRRGTWSLVRQFDVPVVVELSSAGGARRHLALTSLDKDRATLDFGAQRELVPIRDLESEWDGTFIVLWKPPRSGLEPMTPGATGIDVTWLRERFAVLDGQPAPPPSASRVYDEALAARVVAFQRANRLAADGIAGAETLAILTARVDATAPSLGRPRTGS